MIPIYSNVRLKDGREGTIVEIYLTPKLAYEIDFTKPDDEEISVETIPPEMIESII